MAIDFPNTPTLNQIFNSAGKSWRWDGSAWVAVTSNVEISLEFSETALSGGNPNTIQFHEMSAVDAGRYQFTNMITRTNLITNPSFETDVSLTTIAAPAGATISRSTAQSFVGSASCAGTTGATAGSMIFGTSTTNRLSVVGEQTYTASLYVRSATVTRSARVRILWYNAAGANITTSDGVNSTTSTSAWQRRSVSATAPATAVTAVVQLVVISASTTETHFLDAILFEAGSVLLPYFDGTYADPYSGYTLTTQGWNGTTNNSTSTATWGLDSSLEVV